MFYILRNNAIALFDDDKERITNTVKFTRPDLDVNDIKETDREIVMLDNAPVFADEHEQELAAQARRTDNEKALADLQEQIAALKAEMATAQLNGDAAWVSELQDRYKTLLGQ